MRNLAQAQNRLRLIAFDDISDMCAKFHTDNQNKLLQDSGLDSRSIEKLLSISGDGVPVKYI